MYLLVLLPCQEHSAQMPSVTLVAKTGHPLPFGERLAWLTARYSSRAFQPRGRLLWVIIDRDAADEAIVSVCSPCSCGAGWATLFFTSLKHPPPQQAT